jgi:hypothetical protein
MTPNEVENQEEEVVEGEEGTEVEGSEEGSTEDEGSGSEEETEEDIAEAKRIYKLLKNPTTATSLVRELARAEGILKEDAPTPREIKEGKASIKDILKEKLGDKYEFLIPQLSDALETILAGERETHQQSVQQIQIDATKRETAEVLAKLARETKGESRKVESRMLELMNEFQIGPGVSIEKYLRGLYAQASSARDAKNATNSKNDKIRRNANDAPSRLQNSSSGAETRASGAGADTNKPMTLKEAVNFAASQQTRQSTRK